MRMLMAGVLALCSLGGCVSLDGGMALSAAGSEAARAAGSSISAVDPGMTSWIERETVLAKLTDGGDTSEPSDEIKAEITRLKDNLAKRRQLMASLAKAYEAFGALAAYDASSRYGAALTELDGSIDAFAESVGKPAADLSNEVTRGGVLLGWYADWQRSRALLDNSPALGARSTDIANLLRAEKELYTALFADGAIQGEKLTIALWEGGFLSARELFADQQLAPGFSLVEDGVTFTSANDKAGTVVKALAGLRAQSEVQRFADQLDANIAALDALAAQHEQFEATRRVDLDELMAIISDLKQLRGD